MEYNFKEIGERIREKRKSLNYNNQDDFLELLKEKGVYIGRNTLSKIENGSLPPEKFTISVMTAMCEIFNCDIGHLLGEYTKRTRAEKIICDEIHLSDTAIHNIKEDMDNSIIEKPTPKESNAAYLTKLLKEAENSTNKKKTIDKKEVVPQNETYIHSLNLILEKYPKLIAYLGQILLHDELGIYTDYTQRGNIHINKSFDIDKPLLDLIIRIKYYVKNNGKKLTAPITSNQRNEYVLHYMSKHIQKLENDNQYLMQCLSDISRFSL